MNLGIKILVRVKRTLSQAYIFGWGKGIWARIVGVRVVGAGVGLVGVRVELSVLRWFGLR